MDSFFFNITDRCYKVSELFKRKDEHVVRVDISNGLVFFDINLVLKENRSLPVKNLDRMNFIVTVGDGGCEIEDVLKEKTYQLKKNNSYLFASSRQDLKITLKRSKRTEVFILFVSDFFIKRYLSDNEYDPINFLYKKLQEELSLELLNETATDALSLYLIEKIIHSKTYEKMNSIITEHRAIEYMIHRFSFIDLFDESSFTPEQVEIAAKAKQIIMQNYKTPPAIKELALLCATNDFKLKSYFKKVYNSTIYDYVQKLRLEQANLLLRDNQLSIGEIANQVGYKHQGHFSAIFFKTFGVYPKDLKKSFS